MLARHPITGKDIRILSLDTSLWREKKTIAWFDAPPEKVSRWSRCDIGTCSVSAARSLTAAGLPADIVVCLGPYAETAAWCEAGEWSTARIVAVPKDFVEFIGTEKLRSLRMVNFICLDEIHDIYPFVGDKWNGSVNDAKVLIGMILHSGRIFPVEPSSRNTRGLRLEAEAVRPQPLWLITQYYVPEKSARRKEIDACLMKNVACGAIDKIVLLNEKGCAPKHKKIEEHIVGKRLTYADVIKWIYERVPRDVLVVFANADIFLDAESWRLLWSADIETVPKFLALLRWDVETADGAGSAKLFGPRADSQDTWVIASNAVKAVDWDWSALDFPFGQGGCDNSITIEMFKKRFLIVNPALTLKTYHLHESKIRNYNPRDIVDKPVYLYIHPTGLHDMKPNMRLETAMTPHTFHFTTFERRVRGPLSAAQARTFCAMVGRSTQGAVQLEVGQPNIWSPFPITLYKGKDMFQTRDGLLYTYDSILVGDTKASAAAWSASQVSCLAASLSVENALVAPLSDAVARDPARYILEYMSKIFLLKDEFGDKSGEFWCTRDPTCIQAVKAFSWPRQEVPVLSREENHQTWCQSVTMWPHQDIPEGFISREEIGALRKAFGLGGWKDEVTEKQLVIVVDSKWITDEVAEAMEDALQGTLKVKIVWAGRTSLEAILHSMRGAWGILMYDRSVAPWCWTLPRTAFVWEVQCEMEPNATLLHTAAAAELEHRLTIVPKGTPNEVEKKALTEKLMSAIKEEFLIPIVQDTGKPKLFLPSGHTGFYAHAGDSFREVAGLWAERGYVDCVPSPIHQVWLGAVGDTLLYDRPTHEWLSRAPAAEQTFRVALFGNPPPVQGGKSWSFWPRRPALVEAAVARGLPSKPWESRSQSVVFYGRSENAVQKGRRSGDWAPVCSEFIHVDGLKKYPYTAEEYLERLSNARYGLCLAGYGYKCHREIECMAMGCVPIVAAEVDMENYAEPPQEGLHYLRVKGPQDVPGLVADITAERWTVMSVACRDWWSRNASVEGMWELTKRLIV